jgi:monosaccharide-transporting ATPase
VTAVEAKPANPTAAVGPVVEAVGVGKTFPGVRALDDVSIRFEPGTVHALVGENGAGKSTLIKVLAGAQRPDTGHLEIGGEQVRLSSPADSAKHGLAFIHQEPNLIDDLTVAENVLLGSTDALRARFLVDRSEMRKRYTQLVEPLGLRVKPSTLVSDLGTADQTLVAIARALHKKAHFIVFDEPTAALSDVESERLFTIIGDLKTAGHTVVYVSHRLHEILRLADTISVLKDGRHVTTLPSGEVRDRDHLVSLILGMDPELRYAAAHTIGELGVQTDDEARDLGPLAVTSATSVPATSATASGADESPADTVLEPVLQVVNLSDGKRVHDVSLALYPGRITGMAGLVGAGRTELAAMLCGSTRPQGGQLFLRGQARRFRSPRQAIRAGIALVPEDRRHLGALRELGVRENLTVPFVSRFNYGRVIPVLNRRREAKFARAAITRLAIKVTGLDQEIATLSGGNQQKVIVSRWIGAGANVFIFDEPTQGVDVGARAEIYAVIRELANEGAAVLMISSDLEEVVEQSDDVLVMREGRVVAHLDTPDEHKILRACYGHDPIHTPAHASAPTTAEVAE